MRYCLIFSLAFLLLVSGFSDAATCDSCHSSSGADGGYIYAPPIISIVHDPFYTPGSVFEISLVLVPQPDYEMRSLTGDITVNGGSVYLSSEESQAGVIMESGKAAATWSLSAVTEGTANIEIDLRYDIFFKHSSGGNKDIGTYYDSISADIPILDLSLSISPGTVILTDQGETARIELSADDDISGIELELPPELDGIVEVGLTRTKLPMGETAVVTITLKNETNMESEMIIRWTEGSEKKEAPLKITIVELRSGDAGGDLFLSVGQITGIAAFILVLIGYFIGGTSFLKKKANALFKTAARRIRFHCALSYLVMQLAFFHIVVLIYGPYRETFLDWEVVLGWLAMLIMVIISINGIFQKRFIGFMGYQNWRRIHAWGTYMATGLIIVHLLTYGSHFFWFRELIGMQ